MLSVTMTRNLLGMEDMLFGEGIVSQVRAGSPVDVTKINAKNFPYDDGVTLDTKLTEILNIAQSLSVVDTEGEFITGYLNTSDDALDLAGRIWHRTPSTNIAELYYGSVRILQYNRITGDIIIPVDSSYIAADTALNDSLTIYIDAEVLALSNTLGTSALLDVGTAPNEVVQLDGTGKLPAVDGSQLIGLDSGIPVGTILTVPYSTPDAGYLECDGSAIDRTTYATLFAKLGTDYGNGNGVDTFNIPNYRGEFLRGWDNGRGIDTGRSLGGLQSDEFKAHSHDISNTYRFGDNGTQGNSSSGIRAGDRASTDLSGTDTTGGSETRPRNISVMYQIKVS